jgi:hypothetical protein
MGAMFTNIKEGLSIPYEAIIGFSMVLFFAVMGLVTINNVYRKRQLKRYSSYEAAGILPHHRQILL